jgi:hypothetical protein
MKPKIKIITFATESYEPFRQRLNKKILEVYPVYHIQKTEHDIDEQFKKDNEHIFKYKRGYGYWLWKPYFILQEMTKLEPNELLFYMDSQDMVSSKFFDVFIEHMETNDLFVFDMIHLHRYWTKRDCFVLMDCDTSKYHNANQLEAGLIGVKNSPLTFQVITEWLQNCQDENIVTDLPNISGEPNFDGFRDHRHDQSILTNLFLKYNISSVDKKHHDVVSYHCN